VYHILLYKGVVTVLFNGTYAPIIQCSFTESHCLKSPGHWSRTMLLTGCYSLEHHCRTT